MKPQKMNYPEIVPRDIHNIFITLTVCHAHFFSNHINCLSSLTSKHTSILVQFCHDQYNQTRCQDNNPMIKRKASR